MSQFEGKGIMSVNKYKQAGDKKPDYTGVGTYQGHEFEVSAWVRDDGKIGLSFKPPYKKAEVKDSGYGGGTTTRARDIDDEIPF